MVCIVSLGPAEPLDMVTATLTATAVTLGPTAGEEVDEGQN